MTAQQAWLEPDDDVGHDPGYLDVHVPGDGPHDVEDLDPEVTLAAGTVDFGAVRVPVPERGTVDVEPADKGHMQAVHVSVPEGRLSVSALAAPKSSRLWPDLVKEIDSSLREGGARVRSFQGDWGRELHATSGAATSRFVGVDGARWMLYGVATGPTRDADALDEQLRRMLRGTIVVRGRSPYPVRTVLPLEVPEHLAAAEPAATAPTATAPAGAVPGAADPGQPVTTDLPAVVPVDRTPPTTAVPVTPDDAPLPTTALPAVRRPVSTPPPTAPAVSVPPPAAPTGDAPPWPDPVRRIGGDGHPRPLVTGPDPDDRPTGRLLPVHDDGPPTEQWAAPRDPGAGNPAPADRGPAAAWLGTGPWPLDAPARSTGGRRRLREDDPRRVDPPPAEPEPPAGRRRAPEPEPYTGRRRAPEPEPRAGRRRLPEPPVVPPRPEGRPIDSHASPASGRRRAPDGPNSTVAVPVHDVLRQGRHAATGPASAPGAETQPWTAFRPAAAETAPWVVTARDGDPGSATVPLPLTRPARPVAPDRPSGRHHRAD